MILSMSNVEPLTLEWYESSHLNQILLIVPISQSVLNCLGVEVKQTSRCSKMDNTS